MTTYSSDFSQAAHRSARFGLTSQSYSEIRDRRLLTPSAVSQFPYVIREALGDLTTADLMAQCIAIHFYLQPVVQAWLGVPVFYTLGWVDDGSETGLFRFDDAFIASRLKEYRVGGMVNMHAWLTLPTMEVIDVSLPTTFGVVHDLKGGIGGIIAMHGDETRGFRYKPMLVGTDFLIRTGIAGLVFDG